MAKGQLTSMILGDVKKAEKQLAKEVAPEINNLFKESVYNSLIEWYRDYKPQSYERTNNFLNVYQSAKTTVNGNILNLQANCFLMDTYSGWFGQPLNIATAFDYMFMNGEHGHGRWMMHQSTPPFEIVDRDFQTGFNGCVQKIINERAKKILFR